jgi:hypothetical protein
MKVNDTGVITGYPGSNRPRAGTNQLRAAWEPVRDTLRRTTAARCNQRSHAARGNE